ncbi:MAG: hypothetical protein SVT52_03780 [Planctomycetota bacterium]|nr:hypothetical protein [Planctomycetota bacterium]
MDRLCICSLLAGGTAGVTAENIEAIKHEMAQAELARKNPDKTSWVENFPAYSPGPAVPLRKGVIGLHSSLSDGQSTVQQFCAVAKSLGYDYVVFTESLEKMNRQKYRQLQQACGEESGPDFRAIPGVEFDLPNDKGRRLRGFAIDPTALPDKKDPWSMFAQLLFRLNAGGTIATPGLNQIDPWHIRFWNSLEVYAYRSGRRIDDSLQTYKSLVASGYDLSAVAGYRVYQAEALKDFKGYATYAEAEDLKNLSGHFRTFFISSGPVVREFALKSYRGQSMPEAGYSACNEVGDILCLSLALESRHPLKEVTIYRGKNVFRRFRPQSRSFSRNIWFVCTEGTQLWLRATDEKGGEAVSSYIGLSNLYNDLMCKDNQNNILKERLLETEDCVYLGGWQTARDRGSLEFALPNADVVPASGERATGALPFVKSMPAFLTSAGPVRAPHPRLERYLFSNDCAVFAHKAEDDKMAAESIFTVFRPRVYGSNMVIFDCRVKLKQELKLGETKALEVDLVKAVSEARLGPWPNYVYVDGEGRKNHGKTEELITGRVLPLGKGGVIGFWPNEVGSFGLYVLDENSYSVALTGKRESGPSGPVIQVGYDWPGKTLAKGDELKSRFLLVLGNGLARDDSEIWKVQEAYGLGGSAAAYRTKLDRGKIISNRYPLVLEAEDYGLSGKIAPADLPNELAVMVKGLNSNWDAGVVDGRGEGIRRVGILDGAAYLTIDTSKGCEFRAGNLLVCDNREIRLTLIDVKAGRIRFEAHNPTDKEAAITVTSPFFAELRSTCRLSPCTSEQVIADVDTAGVTEEVGQ